MAIGSPYITASELRLYLSFDENNLNQQGEASVIANLASAVESASRQVDHFCNRQFNRQEFATPRSYYIDAPGEVTVDDFWDSEGFLIAGAAGPYSQIRFEPLSGVVNGNPGWPFYRVRYDGGYSYNSDEVVTVTAKWGWPAVPPSVKQATKIIAAQNFKMAEAPMGTTGMANEFGGVMRVREIPMARQMLDEFVRDPIMIA